MVPVCSPICNSKSRQTRNSSTATSSWTESQAAVRLGHRTGGSIDKNYQKPIRDGFNAMMENGILAGYNIDSMKVRIHDGSMHAVDSSRSPSNCAKEGFRAAVPGAKPADGADHETRSGDAGRSLRTGSVIGDSTAAAVVAERATTPRRRCQRSIPKCRCRKCLLCDRPCGRSPLLRQSRPWSSLIMQKLHRASPKEIIERLQRRS